MDSDVNEHEEWLNLTREEVLDPDLPICDPHHHLWDGPGDRGRYLLEEFLTDSSGGHNIISTVFMECGTSYLQEGPDEMRPVGETKFISELVVKGLDEQKGGISVAKGIVAFADLLLGWDVARVIEAQMQVSDNRMRGIRQLCIWDADPEIETMGNKKGMLLEPKFREGFSCLGKYGLVFDAWQYFTQLLELKGVALKYPDTIIVVNHTGGPLGIGQYYGKRDEVLGEWKKNLTSLAECPNVFMKLGGLGLPRCGFGWHEKPKPPDSIELAENMAPYFNFCIEKFGIDRCMFESNFPVDKVSYSYTVIWNAFKRICKDFSPDERSALFHDNAVKVYRLS